MGKVVHIIPVESNKDKIIESIKTSGYPIHKAYLVLSKSASQELEEKRRKVAEDVEVLLKALIDVEKIYVDEFDVYGSAIEILKVIKKEMREGCEVLINASDSPRNVCIACYVAAQISKSRLYTALPKYGNGSEVGIGKIIEVPVPPLKRIGEDKIDIIKVIEQEGGEVESINKLIEILEGKIEDHKMYMAQRARMSYHLNGLEEDGIIITKREGKNVRIILTDLGKAYAVMLD